MQDQGIKLRKTSALILGPSFQPCDLVFHYAHASLFYEVLLIGCPYFLGDGVFSTPPSCRTPFYFILEFQGYDLIYWS